jgi:hypothetical protein
LTTYCNKLAKEGKNENIYMSAETRERLYELAAKLKLAKAQVVAIGLQLVELQEGKK